MASSVGFMTLGTTRKRSVLVRFATLFREQQRERERDNRLNTRTQRKRESFLSLRNNGPRLKKTSTRVFPRRPAFPSTPFCLSAFDTPADERKSTSSSRSRLARQCLREKFGRGSRIRGRRPRLTLGEKVKTTTHQGRRFSRKRREERAWASSRRSSVTS